MADELRPRQYAALALDLEPEARDAWIAENVPAEYQALVQHHVHEHAMRVSMLADYVLRGQTREERAALLEKVPEGVREEVRLIAAERYQRRKVS